MQNKNTFSLECGVTMEYLGYISSLQEEELGAMWNGAEVEQISIESHLIASLPV